MNRSGRRVISATIAAGVLCSGSALVCAAPSVADQEPGGTGSATAGAAGPGFPGDRRSRARPGAAGSSHPPRDRPCPWPWPAPPPPASVRWQFPERDTNGIVIPQLAFRPPVVPAAQISGGARPAGVLPDGLPDLPAAGIPAPMSALRPAAPAAPAVRPATPAAPPPRAARIGVAPPPAAPPPAPAVPPRSVPAAPPSQNAAAPSSWRLGYPEELRQADVARVVALALPGLAAIAGMTALGGFVGYRQAKAGYALPAAGAGRFLQ